MVIHTDERLQTPRLTLQPFRDEDLAAACALLCSAEVAKTYMLPDLSSPDEAAPLFRKLKALSESEEHFVRGIYLHETLIGFLNDVEIEEDSIELGYVIAPAHWGNGCATEALAAAIDALFAAGFSAVTAGYFEENTASGRVMEKCGMRRIDKTDSIDYRGVTHKCIYYAIENVD